MKCFNVRGMRVGLNKGPGYIMHSEASAFSKRELYCHLKTFNAPYKIFSAYRLRYIIVSLTFSQVAVHSALKAFIMFVF